MTLKDFKSAVGEFWGEFIRQKAGVFSLIILGLALAVVIFQPLLTPFSDVEGNWRKLEYWENGSAGAKPVWTNLLARQKGAVGAVIEDFEVTETRNEDFMVTTYAFEYDYRYDLPPVDIIFQGTGYDTAAYEIEVERPDGEVIVMPHLNLPQDGMVVNLPEGSDVTVPVSGLRYSVANRAQRALVTWARMFESEEVIYTVDSSQLRPTNLMFAKAIPGLMREPEPLHGVYTFRIIQSTLSAATKFEDPALLVIGRVSGLMGTDTSKRDIWTGLVAGMKWALLIGFVTSAISVIVGVFYGIITAYFGGRVDAVMSFIFEIFISMPVLPILIIISAFIGRSIWILIGSFVIFNWVGPVKVVRSMALQIKEETYIEAAKALGANHGRIIFKHMAPLLLPYAFSLMALSVPGAIVAEASLSLLGLGDPSIISWGQILQGAVTGGAVLNGLWWWVVPPGLAIALLGMTFAFLGQALDKILHPKLRTR